MLQKNKEKLRRYAPLAAASVHLLIAPFFEKLFHSNLESIGKALGEAYSSGWTWFTSLIIYVIVDFVIRYFEKEEVEKNKAAFNALKEIHNELPENIRPYCQAEINEALRRIHWKVSNLTNDGLRAQSTHQKISIIRTLIQETSKTGITKFYATSIDLPSKLITLFRDYFDDQKKYLPANIEKSRVVILTKEQMDNEIEKNYKELREFIEWHIDPTNNFKLRFLINHDNAFEKKSHNIIKSSLDESTFLNDFAIIGDRWIYGESTLQSNIDEATLKSLRDSGVTDEQIKVFREAIEKRDKDNESVHTLKLYPNLEYNTEIWQEYEKLNWELWHNWHHNQWPMMSAEQALSEIERFENLKTTKEERINFYNQKFPKLKNKKGNAFVSELLDVFGNFREKNISATDLTSLKFEEEFEKWKSHLYQGWLQQNISVAKNQKCSIARVYILNKKIPNKTQASEIFKHVFLPQIEAEIRVFVVNAKELIEQDIKFHDFVLVEQELCASTQWYEHFENDDYCIEHNFDNLSYADFYSNSFTEICSMASPINTWNQEKIIQYLMKLEIPT